MRYTTFALAMVSIIAVMMAVGCGGKSQPEPVVIGQQSSNDTIVDEVWFALVDEPDTHFQNARESFAKKDMAATAASIRKATAYLILSSTRATESGKKGLLNSVKELDKLADDVEAGQVKSVEALEKPIARAYHALASHHHQKAEQFHNREDDNMAAKALTASAHYLNQAASWSGQNLAPGASVIVDDMRYATGSLIRGTGWVVTQTGRGVKAVGKGGAAVIGAGGKMVGGAIGLVGKGTETVGEETGKAVGGAADKTGKTVAGAKAETKSDEAVKKAGEKTAEAVGTAGRTTGKVIEGVGEGTQTVGKETGKAIGTAGKILGWGPEQLGKGISAIGNGIQDLGRKIEPETKPQP